MSIATGQITPSSSAPLGMKPARPGRFVYQRPELDNLLEQFGRAGGRFRVLDADGWVLSDAGSVRGARHRRRVGDVGGERVSLGAASATIRPTRRERPSGRVSGRPAARSLHGDASRRGTATTLPRRDRDGRGADSGLRRATARRRAGRAGERSDPDADESGARAPDDVQSARELARGARVARATRPAALRVRRLAHAAENALGPHGEIRTSIPGRLARDEIGDLVAQLHEPARAAARPHRLSAHAREQAVARAAHAARGGVDVVRQPRARGRRRPPRRSISRDCGTALEGSMRSSRR